MYFFLSNLDAFSVSYLTALGRTSSTMVYRSGESCHPCLVEKLSAFLPLSMVLAVGFSYITFIMLSYSYVPSIPGFRIFNHERLLHFVKCFFASIEMIFIFHSISAVYRIASYS